MQKDIKLPQSKLSSDLLKKRLELNVSQREMATKIGVSYPVYAGLERGTYTLTLKLLTKLAIYLNIDVKTAYSLYVEQ